MENLNTPSSPENSKPAIILLAAGSSSRLGQPKQLLKHGDSSFIQYFILEALKVSPTVLVILGSGDERIRKEIENFPVQVLFNPDWEEGMASSIRVGMEYLMKLRYPNLLTILMVCDQPFVNEEILGELYRAYKRSLKPIIASEYQDTLGTPVLFHKSFYPELLKLKGCGGAKKIVSAHLDQTYPVPFPMGFMDIDTPQDMETWIRNRES